MIFNRFFINLNQVDFGYATKNKQILGRCKIETNGEFGQICLWMQNLQPGEYDFYLMAKRQNKFNQIKIGEIKINKSGYGELNFKFPTNKFISKDIMPEEINIVALTLKDSEKIISEGYKDIKIDWHKDFKNSFITKTQSPQNEKQKTLNDIDLEQKIANHEKNKSHETILSEPKKNINDNQSNKNESTESNAKENVQEKKILLDEQKETNQTKSQDNSMEHALNKISDASKINLTQDKILDAQNEVNNNLENNIFKIMADKIKQEFAEKNDFNYRESQNLSQQNKIQKNNLERLFETNEKITPFKTQKKEIYWIRLRMKEILFLPLDIWNTIDHPVVLYAYLKNSHFIFGKEKNNRRKFIFGLPDKYQSAYKSCMSKLGFCQFKSLNNKKNISGNDGYWLMPIEI